MKYISETLKYMLRNLLYILPMGLLPGLVFVGAFDYAHFSHLVKSFFTGKLLELSYFDLFSTLSILNVSTWYGTLISIIGFFVVCCTEALLLALIEKHMRIGKRTLNGIFSKLNDNIVATLFVGGICAIVYEIWMAVTALILFSIIKLFAHAIVAAYLFFIVAFCFSVCFTLRLIGRILLWIPCQLITGFRVFESLTYSAHLSETNKKRFDLPLFLPFGIGFVILCICVLGGTPALAPFIFIIYLFFSLYYGTLMEVAYFRDAEMEREDLKPAYKRRNV